MRELNFDPFGAVLAPSTATQNCLLREHCTATRNDLFGVHRAAARNAIILPKIEGRLHV
jgi:hypothetical protein